MAAAIQPPNNIRKNLKISDLETTQHQAATYQYLEDLATAYWSSEVLFAALDLKIFFFIGEGSGLSDLADRATCKPEELSRLLHTLADLALIKGRNGVWTNSELAALYLVPGQTDYLGDFLLYRRYLQPHWQELSSKISNGELDKDLSAKDSYEKRNLHYVQALDALARLKAEEISTQLASHDWQGPILDVGGGAGSICRRLLKDREGNALLFEMPEVIAAAQTIYPLAGQWQNIESVGSDFRSYTFDKNSHFGVIIFSNFLHTYDKEAAKELIDKAALLLSAKGLLIIHDYFPDRQPATVAKGSLYDLNMMLNTYAGHCHKAGALTCWLRESGLNAPQVKDLPTDSSLIIADRGGI